MIQRVMPKVTVNPASMLNSEFSRVPADLVALAHDLDRLHRLVAGLAPLLVLLTADRQHPEPPDAGGLGAAHREHGAAGEEAEHPRASAR